MSTFIFDCYINIFFFLLEFIAWSLFHKRLENIDSQEDVELEELLAEVEIWQGFRYKLGRNDKAHCIRPTIEPLRPLYRPFIYYCIIECCYLICSLILMRMGFKKIKVGKVEGWFYPGKGSKKRNIKPFVFFHGVGVGLIPYVHFIHKIQGDSPILLLELNFIASRLSFDIPSTESIAETVKEVLKPHLKNSEKIILCGHSFGTIAVGWVLRSLPHSLIHSTIFIDPVCFLLNEPNVAYNFLYKPPISWMDWLLYYFAAAELGVQHAFRRNFFWQQNILYLEDLPSDANNLVFLSSKDSIAPKYKIYSYLSSNKKTPEFEPQYLDCQTFTHQIEKEKKGLCSLKLKVTWINTRHAGFLVCTKSLNFIVSMIKRL